MRVNFVLSTFNQAARIIRDLKNINRVLSDYTQYDCRLYLLNNGSTDATKDQLVEFMANERLSFMFYLIEADAVLGPAETTLRVLQSAFNEPSDYIIKLDSHREVPHQLVIYKFLKELSKQDNPFQLILSGLKSVMSKAPDKNLRKYRQQQIAEEMAATFSSSSFFQDAINAQGYPTEILKQLMSTPEFKSNSGRRGWDLTLPMKAKKQGCQLTTIPFYPDEIIKAKDRNFGVQFKNDSVQALLKRFSATN